MGAMSDAPAGLINIDTPCFTKKYCVIQWVRVWHGRVIPVEIIPNKIVSPANLEPGTKTSAECRVCVVDARIDTRFISNELCGQRQWKIGLHSDPDAFASEPLGVGFVNPLETNSTLLERFSMVDLPSSCESTMGQESLGLLGPPRSSNSLA